MKLITIVNRGLLTIYGTLFSFVVVSEFISNWFARNILESNFVDFIIMITVLLLICIGWTWWSYKVVKWKIWAFSQIESVDSSWLYERAVAVGLIWP